MLCRDSRAAAAAQLLAFTLLAVDQAWSLMLTHRDIHGTSASLLLELDESLFANSSIVGLTRKTGNLTSLLYTHQVDGVSAIYTNSITIFNHSGATIYRLFDFDQATLDFDGEQIVIRVEAKLTGLLIISGWPRIYRSGQTEVVQPTGFIGSKVYIVGAPTYNGSHILVQANGKLVACYKAPGFPVITKTAVTIERLAGNDGSPVSAHAIESSSTGGQMLGCILHQMAIEPQFVRLSDRSNELCTTLTFGTDIGNVTVSDTAITITGSDGRRLTRLDANVTAVRYNGTHVVIESKDDVWTSCPASGTLDLSMGNSMVHIGSTARSPVLFALLNRHDGLRFNGTHMILGSASFYVPGRLNLSMGSAARIVDDGDGSIKATIEVPHQATIREGFVDLGLPGTRSSSVFAAAGMPQLDNGAVTIRHPLGAVTAEIFCDCSYTYFNGSQIDLFSDGKVVVSVQAVGAAVLDGTSLSVVGENKSVVATIAVGLAINISKSKATFVSDGRTTLVDVVRQGLVLYNGSHLTVTTDDGRHTLVIGLPTGPHISNGGARFGDEDNCTLQPCLVVSISGPSQFNGSMITLSSGDDEALFKAEASIIAAADGFIRFISSNDSILATAEYARNDTVYIDDKRASFLEAIHWAGDCTSTLASARQFSGRLAAFTVDLRGQLRFYNRSHVIVHDEEQHQDVLVQVAGDVLLDAASNSCCIVDEDRRQLLLALTFGSSPWLVGKHLTMASGNLTYNLSASGVPVYNDSRVDIHSGGQLTTSIAVGSLVTLFNSSIVFSSASGVVLLGVAINEAASVVWSNGIMDVLADDASTSVFSLLLGHTDIRYKRLCLELNSLDRTVQTTIYYRSAIARVRRNEVLINVAGGRNITIDLRGVPHIARGSANITGDRVAFTMRASSDRLNCKRSSCWLAENDGTIILEVDTTGALPYFSESGLTILAASSSSANTSIEATSDAAAEPYLTATVQKQLRFNGTVITGEDLVYDIEAEGQAVYNGSTILLVSEGPLAQITGMETVRITSEGIVFSSSSSNSLTLMLPPATHTRIDTCKAVTEDNSRASACIVSQLNGVYAQGSTNVSADVYGWVIIENGTASIGESLDSTEAKLAVDGLGSFTFAADELLLDAASGRKATVETALLSISCSNAVPHFSRRGVDFASAGATPVSIRASYTVPHYNCSHIILTSSRSGQASDRPVIQQQLGTFAVSGALRHDGSTTLSLVGPNEVTVAVFDDIRSLNVGDGVVEASDSDGGEVTALLCAPGNIVYDGHGMVSVLNGSGHSTAELSVSGSTPAFAGHRATFAGARSNLTIQLSDRSLVVDSGKSITVGRALFKIAGKPVDDGHRLRIKAANGSSTSIVVLAEIAYGGTPLFVNGSVVYVDANDSSSRVVVKNTGRPYVYLRARDHDDLQKIRALGGGEGTSAAVGNSWIVAKPDNASTGLLRLLQPSDRLAFNGTHLAVYGGENGTGGDVLALISLARPQAMVPGNECSAAAPLPATQPSAVATSATSNDWMGSTLPPPPSEPRSNATAAGRNLESRNETKLIAESTSADGNGTEVLATSVPSSQTSACVPASPLPTMATIVPSLGDDCVMRFLEDGLEPPVASVQLPDGCRVRVSRTGEVRIDDDSGVLAMSLDAKKASAVSAGAGSAVLRDSAGEPVLTVSYESGGVHRLRGDSVDIFRPDGSSALAVQTGDDEVIVSGRDGAVSIPSSNSTVSFDLRLPEAPLSVYVNGSSLALLSRDGTMHAAFTLPDGVEPSLLLNASHSSLSLAAASGSAAGMAVLTVDLGPRGVPVPIYNGSHLVVLDAADGSLLAALTASDAGPAQVDQHDRKNDRAASKLWSAVRGPPRQQITVVGIPSGAVSAATHANQTVPATVVFRDLLTGKVTAELDFEVPTAAAATGTWPSLSEATPALILHDDQGRPTAGLRINGSLVVVDGSHVEYVDGSGAMVAKVRFDGSDWYSSSNGTHLTVRSPSGNSLAVVRAAGTPSLDRSSSSLCPHSYRTGSSSNETSASESGRKLENYGSNSSLAAEQSFDPSEALKFPGGPGGVPVVVCLRPEAGTSQNGSHWVITSGNETQFVVPISELTAQPEATTTPAEAANITESSADVSITAGASFSPAVGPVLGNPGSGAAAIPASAVLSSDEGPGGAIATRFVFIVMLTVCCIFLVGAAAMYVIMHWSNREHSYIPS